MPRSSGLPGCSGPVACRSGTHPDPIHSGGWYPRRPRRPNCPYEPALTPRIDLRARRLHAGISCGSQTARRRPTRHRGDAHLQRPPRGLLRGDPPGAGSSKLRARWVIMAKSRRFRLAIARRCSPSPRPPAGPSRRCHFRYTLPPGPSRNHACAPASTTPATPSPQHFSARRPQPSSVGRLRLIGQVSSTVPARTRSDDPRFRLMVPTLVSHRRQPILGAANRGPRHRSVHIGRNTHRGPLDQPSRQ